METRAHHLLIGSFMLAFLVAIVAFVLWLAKTEVDREVARYNIYFSGSVAGLGIGGDVRFNGIKVGSVAELVGKLHHFFQRHAAIDGIGREAVDIAIVLVPHHQPELGGPDAEAIGNVLERSIEQQRFSHFAQAASVFCSHPPLLPSQCFCNDAEGKLV